MEILRKSLSKIFDKTWIHVRVVAIHLVKIGGLHGKFQKCHLVLLTKRTGCAGLVRAPILPHLAERAQNFLNVERCMCTIFGPGSLLFAGVIPKRLLFRTPRVITISAEQLYDNG